MVRAKNKSSTPNDPGQIPSMTDTELNTEIAQSSINRENKQGSMLGKSVS